MWATVKIILILFQFFNVNNCDLYASLSDLEELVKTKSVFTRDLDLFIKRQEDVLAFVKSKIQHFKREHALLLKDSETYLSNPLNAFLLIKRMTADVQRVLELSSSKKFEETIDSYEKIYDIAGETDLNGSVMGLLRLQKMYNLSTADLANGIINGAKLRNELSAEDCYEIGRVLVELKTDYDYATLWLEEAWNRFDGRFLNFEITKIDILEYLVKSYKFNGKHAEAYETAIKLQKMAPKNSAARMLPELKNIRDNLLYEEACRGNLKRPEALLSQLFCYYERSTSNFLKLAPIKVEQVNKEPQVLLFHEIVYDSEIKLMKDLTRPKTERSSVLSSDGPTVSEVRVSKIAWLTDDLDDKIAKMTVRVGDMTGLSMETVEQFQTQTYGIGGHYKYHHDYLGPQASQTLRGDRIATVLIYLSDVEMGGATVFPYLKISVQPRKGTAIFWYNLLHNGFGDYRTLHGACPVLIGSKWAVNKWIHEGAQTFRRPCKLVKPSTYLNFSAYYE